LAVERASHSPSNPMPVPEPHARRSRICGAKTRAGGTCRQPAMANGRCRLHGGVTPDALGSPYFKYGRYSEFLPARLAAAYQDSVNDPSLLSLRDEIGLIDSRIADLLARTVARESPSSWQVLRGFVDAALSAQSEQNESLVSVQLAALKLLVTRGTADDAAWDHIHELVQERRRLVDAERRRSVDAQRAIPVERVMVLVSAIMNIIRTKVSDQATLAAIVGDMQALLGPEAVAL
jgi:hypothetical protein